MSDCFFASSDNIVFLMSESLEAYRTYVLKKNQLNIELLVLPYYSEKKIVKGEYYGCKQIEFEEFIDNWDFGQKNKYVVFERNFDRLSELINRLEAKGLRCYKDYVPVDVFLAPWIL